MKRHDRLMKSPDMFAKNTMQLFSVRTGNRVGYESNGIQSKMFLFDDPADDVTQEISGPEPIDEKQLTLEL